MTNPEYNITIMGKSVLVTDAMKTHAQEKLSKIEKFHNHIMNIQVKMDIEHLTHKVVIIAKFDHFKVKAEASSADMYASIDLAVERLQRQLSRWKEQIQDHSQKKLSSIDLDVLFLKKPYYREIEEFNEEIEEENAKKAKSNLELPHMTKKKTIPLKELKADEAIMKLELSKDHFLLYRSEEDRKLKVMYRREDGNYGIIQSE
ncbi:MAG: ribosome-associated translation inhibitor RaiA [Chlamydiota bacterium]